MNAPTDKLPEVLRLPRETQVILAEQRRRLAIIRYEINARHGVALFNPIENEDDIPPSDNSVTD